MPISKHIAPNHNSVKNFLISFYLIGFIGIAAPVTRYFFLKLIPFALIINIMLLAIYHNNSIGSKTSGYIAFIIIAGFFVEVIGTETGLIFGNYVYGDALGIKLFNTPVIMGFNWLLLSYLAASIIKFKGLKGIVASSLLMVFFDMLLEQVASETDMWYWENGYAPAQNYLAWFAVSLVFQSVITLSGLNTRNILSATVFLCQSVFFVLLLILFRLS